MSIRSLFLTLVVVIVLIAVGVGILMGKVDNWRPRIQAELQEKLSRPVSIDRLSLKLLPPQIQLQGFSIAEAPSFPQDRPFAKADKVFLSLSILSLLSSGPEVKNLRLEKPQIELIRNAAGVWNFSSLGKGGGNKSSDGTQQFKLDFLKITDGQVGYTDQLNKQARNVYDHIDLTVTDFRPGEQFGLNLGVHFPGAGRELLEFAGKAGPVGVATENAMPPINGHLSIQQVSMAGINQFLSAGTIPADTNAVASGEADINSLADVIGCKGTLRLDNTVLNGSKMDYPITSTYNIEDDLKQKKLIVRSGILQLGPTNFFASGDVSTASTPTRLNVRVKTDRSSITELAKLAGGLGFGFDPAYNVAGKVTADVTVNGTVADPRLNGSIRAQNLSASGGEIKQAVSIPEIDLTFSPDSILSNTFSATSGSTTLAIAFTLLQYSTANRSIDATVKTDGAQVGELLNIAKTYGVDAAKSMTGDGKLTLDLHVKGPLANASALNYAGTANLAGVTLATQQLKKPLSIATANMVFSQNSVSLDNLAATLGSTTVHGSLSAKNFAAPQLTFNLNADKIDTDELQNIMVPAASKDGAKSAKAEAPSLLLSTTGSGMLAAGLIKASDIELKNVNTKCQLNQGVVELSALSADVFGGKANGTLTTDLRPTTPHCAVKMKFAGVEANALLSAVSSMKDTVYGSLAADTNLNFALVQSKDLARTLNGAITFNLTNGLIKNVNILSEVSKVGQLLKGGADATNGTALKKFAGTLNIANGVATTQNLTGELTQGTMTAKGTLNLVSQEVNMHLTAALGNSAAGQPAGGGLLGTVLATARGSLMVPVLITGNMAHPNVAPDTAEMAKLKLSNAAGSKGAVGGILGGLLGGQTPDGKTKKPSNPAGSILDQFKKQQ